MEPIKTGQIQPEGPLGDELEMFDDDTLSDIAKHEQRKTYKARDRVEVTKEEYGTTLLTATPTERLIPVVGRSCQFWSQRLGANASLTQLKQPVHAKTLLMPAVDAVLTSSRVVYAEAPAALAGVNLDEVVALRRRLLVVRAILGRAQDFVSTLQALESHLENALDQGVRVIYERVKSLSETHRVLGRELEPLKRLVTQSAEDAAETRKVAEKARQQGRAEAMTEMVRQSEKAEQADKASHKPGDKPADKDTQKA